MANWNALDDTAPDDGLDRIEESTETINRGMSDPLNYLLLIGAIVGVPLTMGLSLGLGIIALLRMTAGGKAYAQAIPPTTADIASPGYGCARIAAALGALLVFVLVVLLFVAVAVYNVDGGMR